LGPVVMIIDDNSSIAQLLSIMLQNNGYTPITAPNGLAALDLLKNSPRPSLILTDYLMPSLNGCEFIEHISAKSLYKNIPVVIITGSAIEELRFPTTNNFKGIIMKPFNINTVLNTVRHLISENGCGNSVCLA
jgi:CheY-like chemotaxis protein